MIAFGFVTHLIFGGVFGSIAADLSGADTDSILISMVAALLPDIDHPKSFLGKYNPIARFMHHRGFTHTIAGCLIFSFPTLAAGWPMWIVVFAGLLSHLVADWLSSWGKWKIRFH